MKKITKKLRMLVLFFGAMLLASCGSSSDAMESTQTAQPSQLSSSVTEPNEANEASNTLVVFFSRTGEQYNVGVIDKGNTAIVADMIVEAINADSFEIIPEEDYYPYTYDELIEVAKKEQDENARPAYAPKAPDFAQYDTIFFGSPVWWGDLPMICYTFLEDNATALAGKTLIPFSTHGGSGLAGFDSKLSSICPDSLVKDGLAIAGVDAQKNQENVRISVDNWLQGLGY